MVPKTAAQGTRFSGVSKALRNRRSAGEGVPPVRGLGASMDNGPGVLSREVLSSTFPIALSS